MRLRGEARKRGEEREKGGFVRIDINAMPHSKDNNYYFIVGLKGVSAATEPENQS